MTPIAMRRRTSPNNAASPPLKESLPSKYDSFFTKTTSSVSDTAPASPALYPPLKPRGMSVPQVTLTTAGPKPRTLTVDLERPPLPLPNVAVDFNFQSIFHRIQECVHKIQDIKKDLEDETTRHR